MVPTVVFSPVIFLLLSAHFSDKLKLRWPFVLAGFLSSAVGFSINLSNASTGVKYFGTFLCVAGSYSCSPGVIAWLGFPLLSASGIVTGSFQVRWEYRRSIQESCCPGPLHRHRKYRWYHLIKHL